ncbi:hypothetical protein C923_02242 [Plasmodium falciparum UGT5.1]|uniref:DUF155 domain-containing protein n=5 Tax=Plasmodium falciparum TaxID=5833 RepID=A0A024WA76_PLAFA|nr:hypothetical protein PFFVO_02137 [Plasmodium falciparum Vietnam Oak-Knoll (FVO)]ETW37096.1 hypothetical protein PFTANZ_02209 [Plasmodium falciparum Tanzania (2000708)]ETW43343.1 hypothetical protein PFNF135_02256 [Plasmodium falciparum NF135/5.C10]ETW52464.1 hypothetical protein PFUGPA_05471 [Plasmodium falciparum Palo Alto/Uganda]EWC77096.1 hypothetical protein C923_02242 [Plasmodium falciparum UGT5.1]
MYVLFNDHLKEEGEQNVKLQICNGQNNSSSENENTLSSKYFRKENRRFKQNINILDKHIILADNFGDVPEENFELPDNKQNELEILRKRKNIEPTGIVIACCLGTDFRFSALIKDFKTHNVNSDLIKIKKVYSEVIFCSAFEQKKIFFLFRFGCIVLWDFNIKEKEILFMYLKDYLSEAHTENNNELDSMFYIMNVQNELSDNKSVKAADSPSFKIKNDIIYIYTKDIFEKLSYSYAFAQSVKLSYFENVVDVTIEKTKSIPECLARTGKIQLKKNDISKKIGELFVNRFYINMNTDMLDTPEIFWDHDDFTDTYEYFGKYLDISKRVEILNHRLDIIKDLYDMLQNELTIQHGYKLEWIVIYLICIEVLIDIVWTIIIKGVFKWG